MFFENNKSIKTDQFKIIFLLVLNLIFCPKFFPATQVVQEAPLPEPTTPTLPEKMPAQVSVVVPPAPVVIQQTAPSPTPPQVAQTQAASTSQKVPAPVTAPVALAAIATGPQVVATEKKEAAVAEKPSTFENTFFGKSVPDSQGLENTKNEITIGSTCPMTGAVSLIGRDISDGMNLIFNKLNPLGGIGGKLVRLKTLDSENDVVIGETNALTLLETTPTFLGLHGSKILSCILPKIKNQELLMFFPLAGDRIFRQKDLKYMVHFRASIKEEITALLDYSVNKLRRQKIGIFYEDSQWGQEGLVQAENALLAMGGLKAVVKATYPENTVEITSAIRIISERSPEVVLCISHARPTYNFILQGLKKGLKTCKFLGLGEIVPIQEILQKSRGVELITSSVVPSPFKSEIPLVAQYRQDMAKFYANKSMSQFFLEGYIIAWIFSETLKQIGPPFKIADVMSKLESLKDADFGGLHLNFDPDTRTLSSDVWINLGEKKQWPIYKKS